MIEDKFHVRKVTGDPDDAVADVTCKVCNHDFDVHMHIFKHKNCEHDLGKSMTVICPQCGIRATTTEHESKVAALERFAEDLRATVEAHVRVDRLNFRSKGADLNTMRVLLECKHCGQEFIAETRGGLNAQWQGETLVIKCPRCSAKDVTTREMAQKRLEVVQTIIRLKQVEHALAELRKGGDSGAETVPA